MNIKEDILYISNRVDWLYFFGVSISIIITTCVGDINKLLNSFMLIFVILILIIILILLERKYGIKLGE